MRRIILASALMLGACTTAPPERIVETVEVRIPVPVRCSPQLGPDPDYPDTDEALAAVPGIFRGVQLLKAGRLMRNARMAELRAALNACRGE